MVGRILTEKKSNYPLKNLCQFHVQYNMHWANIEPGLPQLNPSHKCLCIVTAFDPEFEARTYDVTVVMYVCAKHTKEY